MRAFAYERPTHLDDALALLAEHGPEARLLAGGTDLIIRLRDGSIRPRIVVDVKRVAELDGEIRAGDGHLRIGAWTVMTDIAADDADPTRPPGPRRGGDGRRVGPDPEPGDPRRQCLQRLTGGGHGAGLARGRGSHRRRGSGGHPAHPDRRVLRSLGRHDARPRTSWSPRSSCRGPTTPRGSVHVRRTRRRGHDLASVTLTCAVYADGSTRLAYGSLGPRPVLVVDESGVLADPAAPDAAKMERLEALFVGAAPSARSMRASPEYRLAMLHVLGLRAVATAIDRLAGETARR